MGLPTKKVVMVQESKSNIWNILTILSFAMLLMLTLASKPVEKLSAALTTKYEKQAQTKVCQQIKQKEELYLSFTRTLWIGGCMTVMIETNLTIFRKDKKKTEEIIKSVNAKEGKPYEMFDQYCTMAYADMVQNTNHDIDEKIISNLYSGMNCNHIREEEVHE